MKKIVSILSRALVGWYIKDSFIKEVHGGENFSREGNYIFAQNHLSYLDLFIDGYLCTPRKFTYIGQVDRMTGVKGFLRDLLYGYAEVIPVNRKDKESKKNAIATALQRLKQGYTLIIYPEGTRSRDGRMLEFKPGVAKLHLESGVPVLPAAIKGTYELMPPGQKLRIKKIVVVNIGKPLDFAREREAAKSMDKNSPDYYNLCGEVAKKIENEVRKLLEKI
jgi:1-acyl-sn-glycerol-3-phosphate acyltransferase